MRATKISLFILLFLLSGITGCSDREEARVETKNLVQGVYASGQVLPENYYRVNSKVSGVLEEILVEVGREVEIGTPLVRIQNEPSERSLEIAENQLELARKNAAPDSDILNRLREQIEKAYAIFSQDSLDFTRFERLQDDDIGSRQAYDRARLQYRTSLSSYEIAKSTLRETRDRLLIELENARSNYLTQKSRTGDYTLLSAIDGTVYNIHPNEGELISPNQPIIEIGATGSFEAELDVDETDITLIEEGQSVYFELDAVEDSVLEGEIMRIYPRIDPVERTARVIASIEPKEHRLYPGMSLEANIVIREKDGVLVLPVLYVNESNEVILEDGSRKTIGTGIRDLNYVEITDGLEEGDVVLKPEP
jgi:multidrug efflux pump subunit AcrA (membrane-fusion protein)